MRNFVLANLAMDSLGPTFGCHEIIPTKPTDRYYTGILAPREARLAEDAIPEYEESDTNSDEKKTLVSQEDYEEKGVSHIAGDELSPVIDPRSYPKNMGLSFYCLHNSTRPEFKIAITYAKYQKTQSEKWQRKPRGITLDMNELFSQTNPENPRIIRGKYYFEVQDSATGVMKLTKNDNFAETYLYVFLRPDRKNTEQSIVTLMLVNNLEKPENRNTDEYEEQLVFQPEIRVKFGESTSFKINDSEPDSDGVEYEDFRYRGREQHARGHLCSVTWGDFDHQNLNKEDLDDLLVKYLENPEDSNVIEGDLSEKPPFKWIDSTHPSIVEFSDIFSKPTLRSEYLPIMVIPAPDMDPKGSTWRPCPSARELSQANDSEKISDCIQPLIDGYSDWINTKLSGAPDEVITKAKEALVRMEKGLETLINDDDARLAFNIANRAIYQANKWANDIKGRDREFVWRKFQLAFALSTVESVSYPDSDGRANLDLLWVATGGGKTEAYLLVMAYSVVLRRLQSKSDETLPQWFGVDVITRYTLRLLTIQQSRRTLGMVTALEWLRNTNWHPSGFSEQKFSEQPIGLGVWVGVSLTPNRLTSREDNQNFQKDRDFKFGNINSLSAIRLLRHGNTLQTSQKHKAAEPAQILNCPACGTHLSFPLSSEISEPIRKINWVCRSYFSKEELVILIRKVEGVSECIVHDHDKATKTLEISLTDDIRDESDLVQIWKNMKRQVEESKGKINHLCFRPGRPGYFPKKIINGKRKKTYDFEIHCPSVDCDLNNNHWSGKMPAGIKDIGSNELNDNVSAIVCSDGWSLFKDRSMSRGMPIPAYTVDEQIYSRAPSIIVSTVDKFAQLPKNPRSGLIFGAAASHNGDAGFSRNPAGNGQIDLPNGLLPPNLIVQDELHLIEGPLGSMVGFYEAAIDKLCSEHPTLDNYRIKYIASSATIAKGEEQVECLFDRGTNLFPPKGRDWKDRGFIVENDDEKASSRGNEKGRLFIGICPIGITGLSTQREIFASLLYHTSKCVEEDDTPSDRYWTTVGYYNAVRELAGARTLLSFEVQEAANRITGFRGLPELTDSRPNEGRIIELSGRMESSLLPQMLSNLETRHRHTGDATDVLLSTSMFGTGVDVDRLNLMVVSGQPKTTAQYIQSAGRVGRDKGGLIISYLRSSRPRDLDHYERFIGYHSQINRHVEAVTVRPFAKPVLERAGGPVQLAWLRNSRRVGPATQDPDTGVDIAWYTEEAAHPFFEGSSITTDMETSIDMLLERHDTQPVDRQIIQNPHNEIKDDILMPKISTWQTYCEESLKKLKRRLKWEERKIMPDDEDRRWTVLAGEHQVGANKAEDSAVYSPDYQAPNSLRTTDGEIQVRTREEKTGRR